MKKFNALYEGRRFADYVYRNRDDSIRVKIHRQLGGRWDYDLYDAKNKESWTFSDVAGDNFKRKRDAKLDVEELVGKLIPIFVESDVLEGWDNPNSIKSTSNPKLKK
jgi:hypothetical protein